MVSRIGKSDGVRGGKLKVAFVCQPWDSFVPPVQSGSIPIWTYEVIRMLRDDCDFVVYSKRKKGQSCEERREGILCRRVSITLDKISRKFLRRIPFISGPKRPFFSSSLYHLPYILKIARDLRRRSCDVVHVMNFSQFVPVIRAFNPGIRIVLNMRCEWLTQLEPAMIERRLTKTDLVVGCSDYITRLIGDAYPRFADCCRTVPNGVDPDRFTVRKRADPQNGEVRLLFVGRLSPEKGIHVLLDALAEVVRRCPQARLTVVGPEGSAPRDFVVGVSDDDRIRDLAAFYSGSYLAQLKKRMPPEVASRVVFAGFVPNGELADYYGEADILINPSFCESFGRSLIEAMACGTAVVASRVGGMPEIIEDGRTGLLVEAGDASSLAEAILRLIGNAELRRSMGQAGRKRVVECYSWEAVAESLLAEYRQVVNPDE